MLVAPSLRNLPIPLAETPADAYEWLKKGNLLIYPTETFYALGCIATNTEAIRRIYQIKKRPFEKPLPLLAGSEKILAGSVALSEVGRRLGRIFWPGPLTILCQSKANMPAFLQNEQGKTAARVTANRNAALLSEKLGLPLVSTSANPAGGAPVLSSEIYPLQYLQCFSGYWDKIALSGWKTRHSYTLPSTVLDIRGDGKIVILREGQIDRNMLKANNFFIAEE